MYAVSSGHHRTTGAAQQVLDAGGNAVDAALAAFFMAWVAEPCMAGAGGGGFATVVTQAGEAKVYDFFCQTPFSKQVRNKIDFFPIEVDFGGTVETFHIGRASTGVPGAVAGAVRLHADLGYMPLTELVEPARRAALEGVRVNRFQQLDFQLLAPILQQESRGRELFFKEGRLAQVGDVLTFPGMADFLDLLSREGADEFYRGQMAASVERDYLEQGGFLSRADFEAYDVRVREPLAFGFRNKTVITNPLPSMGGAILALGLHDFPEVPVDELPTSHAHVARLLTRLRQVGEIDKRADAFARAMHQAGFQAGKTGPVKRGSTTHLSVVDRKGNAVSLTASNGEGCGYFIEHTDIQLNNMLGEAALLPGGFHSWQPDTRLSSLMSPTILLDENQQIEVVTGSSGAGRIPYSILQVLHYMVDYRLPVWEAVNAPRVHWVDGQFNIEPGLDIDLAPLQADTDPILWKEQSLYFGGVNTVARNKDVWEAAPDERREGSAVTGSME
jgi:gamma-glutamyltranspeptidase/glutathione hydrolase